MIQDQREPGRERGENDPHLVRRPGYGSLTPGSQPKLCLRNASAASGLRRDDKLT
jgi:hypothetical protein